MDNSFVDMESGFGCRIWIRKGDMDMETETLGTGQECQAHDKHGCYDCDCIEGTS